MIGTLGSTACSVVTSEYGYLLPAGFLIHWEPTSGVVATFPTGPREKSIVPTVVVTLSFVNAFAIAPLFFGAPDRRKPANAESKSDIVAPSCCVH